MTIQQPDLSAFHAMMAGDVARTNFLAFVAGIFDVLHRSRGIRFLNNWHVEAMCHQLERVANGENRRLLITVPPRHLKTICTSVGLTAWTLGHRPASKVILASYGKDLAAHNLANLRRVMESPFYRRLFPETRIEVRGAVITTTAGGSVKATSVGGPVTGHGADLIIIDDLMKAHDQNSDTERENAWEFVTGSLLTRFDDRLNGAVVSIQQRLHEDDVAGRMIASGEYYHLNLPSIAVEDQQIPLGGGRIYMRRKDDPLFSQSFPRAELDKIRREHGDFIFSAQYQQDPTPPGGNRMSWSCWGTYEKRPRRDELEQVVQSWDTGMTAEPTSDYSACTTWGHRGGVWYLLDVYRAQLDYAVLKRKVVQMSNTWGADRVIIEHAQCGIILLRELRQERAIAGKLRPFIPKDDKQTRFETQVARIEPSTFLLPTQAPWLAEFRHECLAFPRGRNDDMVDSMTQFLMDMFVGRGRAMLRGDERPVGKIQWPPRRRR
ncbi:phage terminase large subunit [Rhizobium sp. RAF56]|uniref:phage terminase large subunit n=1 Tax=Rhizobium sp. RAF56 TaxID=3233062 RepID=UPI003F9E0E39